MKIVKKINRTGVCSGMIVSIQENTKVEHLDDMTFGESFIVYADLECLKIDSNIKLIVTKPNPRNRIFKHAAEFHTQPFYQRWFDSWTEMDARVTKDPIVTTTGTFTIFEGRQMRISPIHITLHGEVKNITVASVVESTHVFLNGTQFELSEGDIFHTNEAGEPSITKAADVDMSKAPTRYRLDRRDAAGAGAGSAPGF